MLSYAGQERHILRPLKWPAYPQQQANFIEFCTTLHKIAHPLQFAGFFLVLPGYTYIQNKILKGYGQKDMYSKVIMIGKFLWSFESETTFWVKQHF